MNFISFLFFFKEREEKVLLGSFSLVCFPGGNVLFVKVCLLVFLQALFKKKKKTQSPENPVSKKAWIKIPYKKWLWWDQKMCLKWGALLVLGMSGKECSYSWQPETQMFFKKQVFLLTCTNMNHRPVRDSVHSIVS